MDLKELKYGLYARKSNESEDKQIASLDDQTETMTDMAKASDYRIVKKAVFMESKSAKIPDQRPEFDKLIELIENGTINAILTYKSNRLARNPKESGVVQQLMFDDKLKAIVTKDKVYLPEDNALIFSIDAAQDSQFSRDLSKVVKDRMMQKAKKGWYPGLVPLGYKNSKENEYSEEKIVVIDDDRFHMTRRMWDMALTGTYTVSQIQRIADKEWGLRSMRRKRTGNKAVSTSAIYDMFKNPFYMGVVRFGAVYNRGGKHTAMVTPEEFTRVQKLISRKDAPRPEKSDAPDPFPYRGIINCGECGCAITYSRRIKTQQNGNVHTFEYCYCTRRRADYRCTQRITITPTELTKRIRKEIEKYTIMDEFFQWACQYLDEFHEDESAKREDILDTQLKAIKTAEKELNELHRMRYKGMVDDDFYESEKQALEDKLVLLRGQFEDQEGANKHHRQVMEKYFNFARYAKENFEGDDDLKKKEVLSIVGQNLRFTDGELQFEPIKYLSPLVEKYPALEKQYLSVGTLPQQRKKEAIASIISSWCP